MGALPGLRRSARAPGSVRPLQNAQEEGLWDTFTGVATELDFGHGVRSGTQTARKEEHDRPPIWDGKDPEKGARTFIRLLRMWLTTTQVPKKWQAGLCGCCEDYSGAIRLELPVTLNEGKSELERIVDIDGKPVITNDFLIAASYQGNISAINLRDGRPTWQEELSTVKDLAVNSNRVIAVNDKGTLIAFGTATGAIIWEQEDLRLRKLTSPASVKNLIAVGDFEGYIHLLNAQNGNFEGRKKVSRSAITEVVSEGNNLIVVDADGRIQKFTTN